MKIPMVPVPATLLLDPDLHPSAILVWMALRLKGPHGGSKVTGAMLQARTGLSRPTIRRALAELVASRWCAGRVPRLREPGGSWVAIPAALVTDRRVAIRGKILYGVLQLTPETHFTHASLSALARASVGAVKRALDSLVQAQWLQVTQKNRLAPLHLTRQDPVAILAKMKAARVRERVYAAEYRGEALMREYLSLLVASDKFEDNARPGFLVNPLTDERMELDRYYQAGVAFEFNGPQHSGPTKRFPSAAEAAQQQARDYMKKGICADEGIKLVVVQAEDLSLETMRRKVGNLLPLRDLTEDWAIVQCLEKVSERHREKAKSG